LASGTARASIACGSINNWVTASETVTNVGGTYQATISVTNGPRFFRLRHPCELSLKRIT
jgi:hypothetical protein